MLTIGRKHGESVVIYPDENIDPTMTVEELFSGSVIEVEARFGKRRNSERLIKTPIALAIMREELLD